MECPSEADLLVAAERPDGPTEELAAHFVSCPSCDACWGAVRRLLKALAGPALPEVSEELIVRAAAIAKPSRHGRWNVLVARLVEDLSGAEPMPSVRGGVEGASQRLFRAGDYDIDLELCKTDLVGQVLGEGEEEHDGEAICVLSGTGPPQFAAIQPTGEFHFTDVRPGRYEILIELGSKQILVSDLHFDPELGP